MSKKFMVDMCVCVCGAEKTDLDNRITWDVEVGIG